MTAVQAWLRAPNSADVVDEGKFTPVHGVECLNKPGQHGGARGLWTSTWIGPQLSGWAQWCADESFAGPEYRVWLLTPRVDAKVYEVDSMAHLRELLDAYGAEGELTKILGRDSMFPYVDFDRLAADGYHGVHLTDEGQWATRLPMDPNAPSLYGWDCESTLWFRWAFDAIEDRGVLTFERDEDE